MAVGAWQQAPVSETFGDRLHRMRRARGWRQVDLAERAGISQAAVSQFERDTYVPSAENLFALAEALGVDVAWLWRGRKSS